MNLKPGDLLVVTKLMIQITLTILAVDFNVLIHPHQTEEGQMAVMAVFLARMEMTPVMADLMVKAILLALIIIILH